MKSRYFLPLIPVLFLIGCSTRTESFEVSVRNDTSGPIIVWLTKSGPPAEPKWVSPEQLAAGNRADEERLSGAPVPPGKTASVGPVTGSFERNTDAVLRVYKGTMTLTQILAISKGDPRRADRTLYPGKNNFVATERGGRLEVERTNP